MDPLPDLLSRRQGAEKAPVEIGALLPSPQMARLSREENLGKSATGRSEPPVDTAQVRGLVLCGFPAQFGSRENVWLASAARAFPDLIPKRGRVLAHDATEFIPYLHYRTKGGLQIMVPTLTSVRPKSQLSLLVPPTRLSQIYSGADARYDLVIRGKVSTLPLPGALLEQIAPGGSLMIELVAAVFDERLAQDAYNIAVRFERANFFIPFGADGRVFLIFRRKLGGTGGGTGVETPTENFARAWAAYVRQLGDYCEELTSPAQQVGRCSRPAWDFGRLWDILRLPPPAALSLRGVHQEQVLEVPETMRTVAVGLPFEVSVPPWFPRVPYHRRSDTEKTVLHWGQRKLFISELQFLLRATRPEEKNIVVVYAGAASGEHLGALVHLLDLTGRSIRNWVLFDTNPFRFDRHIYGRVYGEYFRVRSEYYTEETSAVLKDQFKNSFGGERPRFLFISDIRSVGYNKGEEEGEMPPEEYARQGARIEAGIVVDMRRQMDWYRALVGDRPDGAGLFKFRLPYDSPGETEYLRGEVLLPVWGPVSTTECRLFVQGPGKETARYSDRGHEERMFFFNNVYRTAHHPHSVDGEYDTCYDCRAEVQVLTDLLLQMRLESSVVFRARLKKQELIQPLNYEDKKAVSSVIWDILEQVNSDINGYERFDRPRDLADWVKSGSAILDNEELKGLLPRIVSLLGLRLNREIGSGRSLHSGDPKYDAGPTTAASQ